MWTKIVDGAAGLIEGNGKVTFYVLLAVAGVAVIGWVL